MGKVLFDTEPNIREILSKYRTSKHGDKIVRI